MQVRIATFNLENLDDGPEAAVPLADRLKLLRPQIARLNADILCLQELNGRRTAPGDLRRITVLDPLLDGLPCAGFHRFASQTDKGGAMDRHNLAILSRWPIRGARQIRHDLVPPVAHRFIRAHPAAGAEEKLEFDRPALAAEIELPDGRGLHVVNLHLRAPLASFVPGGKESAFVWSRSDAWAEGFYLSAVKRVGQALEARLYVDDLLDANPDALIAVAGDCNAAMRENALRVLCASEADTSNSRLSGRSLFAVEDRVSEPLRHTVIHAGERVMLDHILVSRTLMLGLRAVEIHNEALGDELQSYVAEHQSPESFHAPVLSVFEL